MNRLNTKNKMLNISSSAVISLASLLIFLNACSMFSGREGPDEYVDDVGTTTKVQTAILGEPTLKSFQVGVETMQGVVQLTGFVDNQQSEYKAVELARHVKGVKAVKDDIIVREAAR